MTFITELMRQPLATAKLRSDRIATLRPDADSITIHYASADHPLPITKSLKQAWMWLEQQPAAAPMPDFRRQFDGERDAYFGLLQAGEFILRNLIVVGVARSPTAPGEALVEMEYANAGRALPNLSAPDGMAEDARFALSRFCYLHREDDRLLLTMPLKDKRFVIRDKAAREILFELASGTDLRRLRTACDGDDGLFEGFRALLHLLCNEGFAVPADKDSPHLPTRREEGDSAMQQWDLHDLIAHSNSRVGYNYGFDFGGAFPFVNQIDPQPAVKPVPEGERIALHRPDLKDLAKTDKRLSEVVMQRISVRGYDEDAPISLRQLGEFLFRTGRVLYTAELEVRSMKDPDQRTMMDFAWRPYPTGGASYELEFYLTVDRAADLDAGMYYYSPSTHELVRLSAKSALTAGLIESAYISAAQLARPQVLIHIAARFQRVAWKYHNIAYSTMLRNTGVVYQTFYLNAIAMGLAPCGLGSGNTDLFARATGCAPHVECSIGEFMLGSLPKGYSFDMVDLSASALIHNAKLAPTAS